MNAIIEHWAWNVQWNGLSDRIGCIVNEEGWSDYYVALMLSTMRYDLEYINRCMFRTPLIGVVVILFKTQKFTIVIDKRYSGCIELRYWVKTCDVVDEMGY